MSEKKEYEAGEFECCSNCRENQDDDCVLGKDYGNITNKNFECSDCRSDD